MQARRGPGRTAAVVAVAGLMLALPCSCLLARPLLELMERRAARRAVQGHSGGALLA